MGMDTSVRVAHGMTRGRKGRGPRGAIGDTDSRSTSGPDPAAGDIRIVTQGPKADSKKQGPKQRVQGAVERTSQGAGIRL